MNNYEEQYLSLLDKLLSKGTWVYNERTGRKCLTLIGESMQYSGATTAPPVLTTKQSYPVSAVAEIIGYLRKYDNANQFADIGAPTWKVNSNETQAWLDNPNRKGTDDVGIVYGAALGEGELEGLFKRIQDKQDDRGLILDFWKPEKFDLGCLRPCMKDHTFSIVGDDMSITSTSRSVDVACGLNFNSIQSYFLLQLASKISGCNPKQVTHNLINVHLYDSHIGGVKEQLKREALSISPKFELSDFINCLANVTEETLHARRYFRLTGYEHQGKIPFELVA